MKPNSHQIQNATRLVCSRYKVICSHYVFPKNINIIHCKEFIEGKMGLKQANTNAKGVEIMYSIMKSYYEVLAHIKKIIQL